MENNNFLKIQVGAFFKKKKKIENLGANMKIWKLRIGLLWNFKKTEILKSLKRPQWGLDMKQFPHPLIFFFFLSFFLFLLLLLLCPPLTITLSPSSISPLALIG